MHNVYWHKIKYLTKVSITSGNTFHTFHAVFLSRPEKMDTVSQPVNVNHIGKTLRVSSPRLYAILCIGRYFRFWPTPNSTHNSLKLKEKKWQRAMITTSVYYCTSIVTLWVTWCYSIFSFTYPILDLTNQNFFCVSRARNLAYS